MKSGKNLFFTEIDLCKPGAIEGFELAFNLDLMIFLKGAKLSNNSLVLFKNISVEKSIFRSSIFSVSFQSIEK